MIGEAVEKTVAGFDEEISVIEANLDDMNPQIYGYFLEKALAANALDVYTTPVQMKKNRPGTLLTVLCKAIGHQCIDVAHLLRNDYIWRAHLSRSATHPPARVS